VNKLIIFKIMNSKIDLFRHFEPKFEADGFDTSRYKAYVGDIVNKIFELSFIGRWPILIMFTIKLASLLSDPK
jgi:hypothetical protein